MAYYIVRIPVQVTVEIAYAVDAPNRAAALQRIATKSKDATLIGPEAVDYGTDIRFEDCQSWWKWFKKAICMGRATAKFRDRLVDRTADKAQLQVNYSGSEADFYAPEEPELVSCSSSCSA